MIHRGKLLEKKIRKSGIAIKTVAEKLHITRQTLYKWFEQEDLGNKYFKQVSEIIGVSFATELPELVSEPPTFYGAAADDKCLKAMQDRDRYLNMYLALQQEFNKLSSELLTVTREARLLDKQLTIAKQKLNT